MLRVLCVCLAVILITASNGTQPNVVLFVIDDLGFADLSLKSTAPRSAGGYARDHSTPEIDALAAEGILLDAYYVNRLCSPTRTSLISSRYAYNLGLAGGVITNGFPVALRLNETCIAQHMKSIGYQTHAFGKWDCGYHTWAHTPTMRGFDSWLGYYNADEDYITHSCGAHGCPMGKSLDLRNDTAVLPDNHTYSTFLYTSEGVRMIEHHDPKEGPFFLYAAYQAVHGPLEAPQRFLDKCAHVTEADRHIFCGMVLALDEGVGNITKALARKGLLDNTIIALTTDNGGQNGVGGNNWPLRGNKATVFEGGVRGTGFVWGGKDTDLGRVQGQSSHLYTGLMHNVDWGPTLFSAGGGNASRIISAHSLDGMDIWPSILSHAQGHPEPSPRKDVLLHLQGPNNGHIPPANHNTDTPGVEQPSLTISGSEGALPPFGWEKTAALRSGDWKVVWHQVEANCPGSLANASGQNCLHRATGWVKLVQDKEGDFVCRSYEMPSPEQSCDDTPCLFDLKNDPTERHNVAAQNPDVLARLLARLAQYNATLIPNIVQPFDTNSCPQHFASDAWTPWLNSTPPLPPAPPTPPAPPPPGLNSSVERSEGWAKEGHGLLASGWCCDGEWPHGGHEVSMVVVRVDPLPPGRHTPVLDSFPANRTRAGLNTTHDVCPNQQHGFQWLLDIPKYGLVPTVKYKIIFNAIRAPEAGGKEQALHNSPQCVHDGKGVAC